tara:strand:- start:23116 stop:24276 length:1161 start_codon:yes stop_codon:yes gene_type:complete
MKKAIVMCFSDPSSDPRPKRFIDFLNSNNYICDVYAYNAKSEVICETYFTKDNTYPSAIQSIIAKLKRYFLIILRAFFTKESFKDFLNKAIHQTQDIKYIFSSNNYDLIIVEDLYILPAVIRHRKSGKIIFDAREYYTRQNEESVFFRIFEKSERARLCSKYLKKCDHILTVSSGLKKAYKEEFAVESSVIHSVPYNPNLRPNIVDPENIKIVHHGVANPNRQIENMIKIVKELDDRFIFDLYLTGSPSYRNHLKKKIASNCNRICIKEPLEFESILDSINKYDIGFFYVEPKTFNLEFCLPNKFFEFIHARLAVAIGPSPEMKEITEKFGCGIISKQFTIKSMLEEMRSLTPEKIMTLKNKSHQASKTLCFSEERKKIESIISKI